MIEIEYTDAGGRRRFLCPDTMAEHVKGILSGQAYPVVPGLFRPPAVILDAGANVGATSVYFSQAYPGAAIHAVEPHPENFGLLERNTAHLPNLVRHRVALSDRDGQATLYDGAANAGTASLTESAETSASGHEVQVREAAAFVSCLGLSTIDVLKLDTEGAEWPILSALFDIVPRVAVIYLEYHNDGDRRRIDAALAPTHLLFAGRALAPHRGELVYVAPSALSDTAWVDSFRIGPP
ncbi:FkbM family methyltransferase [Azospirillum sp. sgz301742]